MKGSSGWWIAAILVVLVIRFTSLSAYPLTDTTEARYGEISRVMASTGNWITPQLEPGVPFWAKPPLSFWQGAISVSLLGTSEFSVRLPMFLNVLAVLMLTYAFASRLFNHRVALISTFIVITSVVGFITSGAVMTDPAMMLSTTLAMISFWFAIEHGSRRWGYCFFFALSIGFLAKGPVAWVLTGVPIVLWLTLHRRWGDLWIRLPILQGIGIVLLLTLPWFVLSELHTPGFLNYFFVGEHFQRFTNSGWTGDLYGTAHDEPRGTIWLFTLAAFAPWSIVAVILAIFRLARIRYQPFTGTLTPVHKYLIFWCLWPSVFFSFAGNILPTYVLPALPAFAILLAMPLNRHRKPLMFIVPGLALPVIMVLASPLGVYDKLERRTQRSLIQHVKTNYAEVPIAYVGKAPHSARFYSRGTAVYLPEMDDLSVWVKSHDVSLIASEQDLSLDGQLDTDSIAYLGRWNSHHLYLIETQKLPIDLAPQLPASAS